MARSTRRTASAIGLAAALALASAARAGLTAGELEPLSTAACFAAEKGDAIEAPAYFDALDKARQLVQHGRYRAGLYATFALPPDADATEVALVRAAAYRAIGEPAAAEAALAPHVTSDPRAAIEQARLDFSLGKYDAAIKRLRPLVADSIPARYLLGRSLERTGDLSGAVAMYAPMAKGTDSPLEKFRKDGPLAFEQADELTDAARCIDRWATITREYATNRPLHDTVLAMLVAAYDQVDRDYWPAHVAAAEYLFSHGDRPGGLEELGQANEANPNAVEVNAMLGEFSVAMRQDNNLTASIAALREVDAGSFDADLLETSLLLTRRQFDLAAEVAGRAAERQPKNLDALAAVASVQAARGDTGGLDATLAKADAIDAKDAIVRSRVAAVLKDIFYDPTAAVEQLRVAVDRAPWWTEPQHALGDALIQDGEEEQARAVLERAQDIDPYNATTVNYLRVLDQLATFVTFESKRFTFKFAKQDDPIISLYFAPVMDAAYDDLVKQYKFEPRKRPIVEVFPDAESFSVRTAGEPGLETFGASLGRVMTVVAPRAGQTLGPFNFARVMKHEFTHTINLMQTHGRVPRWLTEGLAVWEEKVPYRFADVPPQWYKLASTGKIPTPREMKQSINETGYMAGFWIVRYLDENLGFDSVLKLLDAYRDGNGDDDAFKIASGMDLTQFEVKFDAWAKDQVKDWGYGEPDVSAAALLTKAAEQFTQGGSDDEAIAAWKEVAKKQPMNPLPPRRLAGLYLRKNDKEAALPYLEQTLQLELQDNRFAKRIAQIHDAAGRTNEAIQYARFAMTIDPYDVDAHDLLGALLKKSGDAEGAAQEASVAKLLRERKK